MVPVRYNIRNLVVRRATTLATAIGVGLVVFVLAAAMMLNAGLNRAMRDSGKTDIAIVLRKGSDSEMPSSIEDTTVSLIKAAPGIKKGPDGQPLVVGEAVVVMFQELANGRGKSNALLRGVPSNVLDMRPEVQIVDGRMAKTGTDEVIVGKPLLDRFANFAIGSTIELRKNRGVTVVGVFEAEGSAFESEIWGDIEYIRQSFGREGVVQSVRVKLESPAVFDGFAAAVEQDKRLGLEAMTEPEFFKKQSESTSIIIMVMGIVAAVPFAAGAILGAMVTMYGAVANRRREIGVLRALGFSRSAIMSSFLFEATVLALLGGVLGFAAASLMGLVKVSMMNFQTFSDIVIEFHPTPEILVTSLVLGGAMGILGGFLPAVRAARTPPVEAMKG